MIERLQRALQHIEELPPDVQEEIAIQIEEQLGFDDEQPPAPQQPSSPSEEHLPKRVRDALAAIGSWRDLQDEDEFEALDRIRHESKPTPPIDLDDHEGLGQ